ncbi:uncharacterized protein LOC108733218 isoform X2 [Agrilus planipennis]|uniref:Uncharacterized protein LOC108733218 isoform X1 n=1 Tax=Agrilus planipennis TaxID=224129 RepID=A0A7F5RJ78_AGRPL|nr:uncharacterized protein LOC108733218 isoform X1 [Agrilus planipennis]XP_025836064.1 uncharacterized protein LOC108733218 isoform X2 [Agrilus planipennis]
MCLKILVFFCLVIAVASASVLPVPAPLAAFPVDGGALLKGPISSSVSVGPDGSSISTVEDSGAVGIAHGYAVSAALPPAPAPVVYAAPAVVAPPPAPVAYAAPAVLPPPPAPVAYAAPAVLAPPPAPVAYAAPVLTGTLINGPSGQIATAGSPVGVIAGTAHAPWAPAPAVVEARIGW